MPKHGPENEKDCLLKWFLQSADWLGLACLIGVIYGTLPVGPKIIRFVYSAIGKEMFGQAVIITGVLGSAAVLRYTSRYYRPLTLAHVVRVTVIGGILCYMGFLITVPAERFHFIEYALVGIMIERVLRRYIQDAGRPFVAMLFSYLVGMGDETVQWLLSNRHGQIRDVFLNGWGGALGVLLVPWPHERFSPSSQRLILVMVAIGVISSTLFAFGT